MWKPRWGEAWWRLGLYWSEQGNKELVCTHLLGLLWWLWFGFCWCCQWSRWEKWTLWWPGLLTPRLGPGQLAGVVWGKLPLLCLRFVWAASLHKGSSLASTLIPWMLFSKKALSQGDARRWRGGGWEEVLPDRCSTCGTYARGTPYPDLWAAKMRTRLMTAGSPMPAGFWWPQ